MTRNTNQISNNQDSATYDVAIVGSGPAGSVAALTLARGGARVALIDKATFPRPKACGDLIGPRAIALSHRLGLALPEPSRTVTDMTLIGPKGNKLVLQASSGVNFPGAGWLIARVKFDAYLHNVAVENGALPITHRVSDVAQIDSGYEILLSNNNSIRANYLIGADGANSQVARSLQMCDESQVLYGFAVRGYLADPVDMPVISLFKYRENFFPGYGWVFSNAAGFANVGVGIGVLSNKKRASEATKTLVPYIDLLRSQGILPRSKSTIQSTLGGWLRMGGHGITPCKHRAILVGDAAGLVNPLQGEGIFAAMDSGYNAAQAILTNPNDPKTNYLAYLNENHFRFQASTSWLQKKVLEHPKLGMLAANTLTSPITPAIVGSAWGMYWNELVTGAGNIKGSKLAKIIDNSLMMASGNSPATKTLQRTYLGLDN